MLVIPPELVELIVGFISSRSTLRACALVGPDFLYPCQQRLFTEVVLAPPKRRGTRPTKATPAQRFLDALNSSPHLASFVRSLIIECEDSIEEQPWLYNDTALQHILPRLDRLAKISVNGKVKPGDEAAPTKANLSWSSLSLTLRSALTSVMRSGSVIDLELGGFSRIPVSSVIHSCSQLKKLSLLPLYLVDEGDGGEQDSDAAPSPPELLDVEDITIKQSSVALRRTTDWLLRPNYGPDIRQVQRLHFTVMNTEDHSYIAQIVEASAPSLKELELSPGTDIAFVRHLLRSSSPVGPRTSPITLSNLNHLRSLKINTEIKMYKLNNNRYSDPLPWIVSLLSTIPHDNEFATLEICLGLHVNKQILESISWIKLVNAVTSEERFPRFERLVLTLSRLATKEKVEVDSQEQKEQQVLQPWVKEVLEGNSQLGFLRKKGLLTLQL
ncbi:hypothetical protein CC1G_07960 [Coprinopsis cinerea okayama7|uniref:F-box domain-containing protein n=1 Tax=Coprinopsis cinerea (strain Okayama-7 / 130 / ATCC MYA-4618 / FGSC 9003) TaxID=240176 RepID=A8P214_COPC7|nr:hypothetical protein CC1G_07960 [Coprinopsis cinerea okayama7\|eukprot:XP_001838219.1 hypothetical protein CC1G_07960 [Coprinopsis cinerea okayama7\